VTAARSIGLEVRAGLHTGEYERMGANVGGTAVHIGARVAGLAGAGEVLVSRTVRDLVVGSGLAFDDRGEHQLKGVPGTWQIFAVDA
jgi:class 3 adenylate cyclase